MSTAIAVQIRYDEVMSKRSLENLSDESLMARIAERDETAFEVLCKRYLQWAHRFDRRFLPDAREAEDAVQEKFLRIWKQAEKFEPSPGSKVINYLLKIDRNICLDMLRKSYRHSEVAISANDSFDAHAETEVLDYLEYCHLKSESGVAGVPDPAESSDLANRIYAFTCDHFSKNQFLVFWGFVSGMSYRELAVAYDMQPGSVRGHIARGFASIRSEFGAVRRGYE